MPCVGSHPARLPCIFALFEGRTWRAAPPSDRGFPSTDLPPLESDNPFQPPARELRIQAVAGPDHDRWGGCAQAIHPVPPAGIRPQYLSATPRMGRSTENNPQGPKASHRRQTGIDQRVQTPTTVPPSQKRIELRIRPRASREGPGWEKGLPEYDPRSIAGVHAV